MPGMRLNTVSVLRTFPARAIPARAFKRRKSPHSNSQIVETRQIFSRFLGVSIGNLVAKWFFDPLNYFYGPRVYP